MDIHQAQELAFQIIAILTVAMPLLEKIANATSYTWDNKVLELLKQALTYVPRVRLGADPPEKKL